MAGASSQNQVVSAAKFRLEVPGLNSTVALAEITGINSRVGTTEYIYNDEKGDTHHTKQFGKTEPPTVVVRRGLDTDGNSALLKWHALAREGKREGVMDAVLVISDASGEKSAEVTYLLRDAWCQELSISAMKAGDGQVTYLEAKISCSAILSDDVTFKST